MTTHCIMQLEAGQRCRQAVEIAYKVCRLSQFAAYPSDVSFTITC